MDNRPVQPPVLARHSEYSMIFSADDDVSHASSRLITLALKAIQHAMKIGLEGISRRTPPPHFPQVWPGEHYRLLAGLVFELKPSKVVEIGTGSGASALAMVEFLPRQSELLSFDIVHWRSNPENILTPEDFTDGRLVQIIDDLSNPPTFLKYRDTLSEAELILVDAAKDGAMEERLIKHFQSIHFKSHPIIIFDDIRLWNMLKIWRDISFPKLDLTSFGHWSGTGLVEWE